MRKFKFLDQDGEHVITEDEIIIQYYPYWCNQMKKVNKENEISVKNCIKDFITIHWAWEINEVN